MSWVATVMALMLSIIGRRPISDDVRSPGLGGNRSVGMTQIAALVAPPHVVDHGIRPLALHLEGSDQRSLGRHLHALVFASDVYADGEFEWRFLPGNVSWTGCPVRCPPAAKTAPVESPS